MACIGKRGMNATSGTYGNDCVLSLFVLSIFELKCNSLHCSTDGRLTQYGMIFFFFFAPGFYRENHSVVAVYGHVCLQ